MDRIDPQPHQHSPDARTAPIPPAVTAALTQYEAATLRYDELAARPAADLTPSETSDYYTARDTLTDAFCTLATAKRLDLIEPAETAARYRWAANHYRDLATHGDYEGCEYVRDEMAMCHCQLADAGRLDLIGTGA